MYLLAESSSENWTRLIKNIYRLYIMGIEFPNN